MKIVLGVIIGLIALFIEYRLYLKYQISAQNYDLIRQVSTVVVMIIVLLISLFLLKSLNL